MPRPDVELQGPERATLEDIEAVNRLFADAFTDRYHRDGMTGVRVPYLNRDIWRYAIEDAGEGAKLWRDAEGHLAAFNMVHQSGAEGWMGPLAVRPALQGSGVGTLVVHAGINWLKRKGARIIGLETMPRTVENIGFYSRLGFVPGHLTVSVTKELNPRPAAVGLPGRRLSRTGSERIGRLAACRALTAALAPGVDYQRELLLTEELKLGDTTMLDGQDGGVLGFALWHSAPLAHGRAGEEFRVLKIAARDLPAFRALLETLERDAADLKAHRISLRCQTAFSEAYAALLDAGYRVHWTDLRMTLPGATERITGPGIVMSNWEI
ncbi:MAG TPA: GNAT family N-acetyltransferase [Gemmatimonadales bacterium]